MAITDYNVIVLAHEEGSDYYTVSGSIADVYALMEGENYAIVPDSVHYVNALGNVTVQVGPASGGGGEESMLLTLTYNSGNYCYVGDKTYTEVCAWVTEGKSLVIHLANECDTGSHLYSPQYCPYYTYINDEPNTFESFMVYAYDGTTEAIRYIGEGFGGADDAFTIDMK